MFFFHVQGLVSSFYSLSVLTLMTLKYNVFSLIFSWFALANIWLTFSIIIDLLPGQNIIIFGTATVVRILGFNFTLMGI